MRSASIALAVACAACVTGVAEVRLPAGRYRLGSGPAERAWGYRHSPPGVRSAGWYDAWETEPREVELPGFWLDAHPVTQADYARFVERTRHHPPGISADDYRRQGFLVHPYSTLRGYQWSGDVPPADKLDHPVVLVSRDDAAAYCAWRKRRLPGESEWEAACRGRAGRRFSWGDRWREGIVHIEAKGTASVDAGEQTPDRPDMLGNVFEWTSSDFAAGRAALRGCSWDDAPGACRCAFRHGRPPDSRHVLIGFRCARDS